MKCPKCHSLLLKYPPYLRSKELDSIYFCIHCGFNGTFKEMVDKLPFTKHIFQETISSCHCYLCKEVFKITDLLVVDGKFTCKKCLTLVPTK